ncbi:MAG: phenylacetate--CoA ligase family protein [Deltaproteobacteria bacterium]|nr:phenylacetate--CoA ligase family protein [Deltaproteobacteria bacterium]
MQNPTTVRDLGKQLYTHLPPSAQEILLSAYFFRKRRRIHNEVFHAKLTELRASEHLQDPDEFRAMQCVLLKPIVSAAANTPHYRDLFARLGITSADISTPEGLRSLPILDKDVVRRDPAQFVDPIACANGSTVAFTSGSTGSPLRVVLAPDYEALEEAFTARQCAWVGLGDRDRRIRLRGDLIVPGSSTTAKPWRRNFADNELRMSSYHLSPKTARYYADRIMRFSPQALIAYPSSANLLASFVRDLGLKCRIPFIFTSSETLTSLQRETIERNLGGVILDHYGCTEATVAIQQCERGTYHVVPEYSITEFVPTSGSTAHDVFDIVSTGLLNTAMPLLRYRTGDRVRIAGDQRCACGRAFPSITEILGRDDDIVVTPRGDHVGRLDHAYKGLSGIAESQIRQESPSELRVLVVPSTGYNDAVEAQLIANLRSRLGDMDILVERVSAIPRGRNGKFRAVISTIPRSPQPSRSTSAESLTDVCAGSPIRR